MDEANKFTVQQVADELKSYGFSELDANLVTDCVNIGKSCTWQNNDEIKAESVIKAQKYLKENNLGIALDVFVGKFGKFIWETKVVK